MSHDSPSHREIRERWCRASAAVGSSGDAPGLHQPVFARWRTAFFLKLTSWRSKKRHTAVRLPSMPRLPISATISSNVKSGRFATTASNQVAWSSNGERLPPRGFADVLPPSNHSCSHLIAELTLMLKRSAASRRDAPPWTASMTRTRKSVE